jgi:hypothetical protein
MQFPEQKAPPQGEHELPPPAGAFTDTAQKLPAAVLMQVQVSEAMIRFARFAVAKDIPWQSLAAEQLLVHMATLGGKEML